MSFFKPVPPEKPPTRLSKSDWLREPEGWIGGAVGEHVLLTRTAEVAVFVHSLRAVPAGLAFEVALRFRERRRTTGLSNDFHATVHEEYLDGELSPLFFRFGIELADGRSASSLRSERHRAVSAEGPPDGPILNQHGGGGGSSGIDIRYWLWPLPVESPLTFVCEWPGRDIPLTRASLDTAPIAAAATRAIPAFAEAG
jgi:hypothetical protein